MAAKPKIEFENDRVRVSRVKQSGGGSVEPASRNDRVIIYLRDGSVSRSENGRQERLQRKAGEVVWRGRSQHHIEVEEGEHEVLIVELKK